MFNNFIYFIIGVVICADPPVTDPAPDPFRAVAVFCFLAALFAGVVRLQFHRLEKRIDGGESLFRLDHRFNSLTNRLMVIAIILFAVDVYALGFPSFFAGFSLFAMIPTLGKLIFLLVFTLYFWMIWHHAYPSYEKIYAGTISRRSYVRTNILFGLPVLLPWLLLFGLVDVINLLPFDLPKRLLSTEQGQIVGIVVFFVFLLTVAGPVLIRKSWRCKPLEPGQERNRIEHLCQRAGVEYDDILYWPLFDGKMITAAVMGLIRNFRYILVTEGLLRFLRPEEIDTVIAHEIGHVKKRHMLFYVFFFLGFLLFFCFFSSPIFYGVFYSDPISWLIHHLEIDSPALFSALINFTTVGIFLLYFRYVFGYFMRNFERQADTYVYTLFDSAAPLISTFEKITLNSGQPSDKPNWHHFSIRERIDYLKKCEEDRSWISRHDRKIKKSMAVYVLAMLLVGIAGYHLNFGETGERLAARLSEKIILRELGKDPGNGKLYDMLGAIFLEQERYAESIEAYENALDIIPDDPNVLNNLAWVYATCEDRTLRNPKRALRLATRAAEELEAPYILDTLAESHYVNGQFEEAVAVGERALELAVEKRSYYEEQLRKFREVGSEGSGK